MLGKSRDLPRRAFVQDVTAGATGLGATITLARLSDPAPAVAHDKVTLEVLDPRGVLASTKVTGLSNPRVSDLNGKKIALLSEIRIRIHFSMPWRSC
jgi:hypothetical protein